MSPVYLDVTIDTSQVKGLARALRVIDPAAKKTLTRGLRAVGAIVATESQAKVRSLTGQTGGDVASLVASSIKVRVSGEKVLVVAGAGLSYPAKLMAGLWELGGKAGRHGWVHPVFNDPATFVFQPSHNYLTSTAEKNAPSVRIAASAAIAAGIDAFRAAAESGAAEE